MSLNLDQKEKSKKSYPRIEDGAYPCRVAQVIDLGRQHEQYWENNKPLYYKHDEDGERIKGATGFEQTTEENDDPVIRPKVWITYELPTETIDVNGEEKPRWLSKDYTISSADTAALKKLMNAIAPNEKKLSGLLGKPGTITIGSTRNGNAKITSVGPIMKGMAVAELANTPVLLDLDNPDLEVFNSLPDFLKDKIKNGEDFGKSKLKKMLDSAPAKGVESKPQSGGTPVEDDRPF